MSSYAEVFGGTNIYPSAATYLPLTLSVNTQLAWPIELSPGGNDIAADIIDVTATLNGLVVQLSDATQVSTGYTALFVNVGALTFTVVDSQGNTLCSIASGQAWQLYLRNNSTSKGTWGIFQYGAGASSANAAALAGAGLVALSTTLNEQLLVQAKNMAYTIQNTDRASVLEWTGGAGAFTLPLASSVGANWFVVIKNSGDGNLVISPQSGTIDGLSSLTLDPLGSTWIVCDGTNFFSLGFGQAAENTFGFITINLAGQGGPTYALSGAQLNQIAYRFTGAITGNIQVVVPSTVQQYWVDNETSGAFTLSVGTSGQSAPAPPQITQGTRAILYCDGSNVYNAVTGTLTLPISVPEGGTGLTTIASGALLYASAANVLAATAAIINPSTLGWSIPAPSSGTTLTLGAVTGATSLAVGLGSAATPAVAFSADVGTGIYQPATGQLAFSVSGVLAGYFDSTRNLHLTNALAVAYGGTGGTTIASALANLGLTSMATTPTPNTLAERNGSGNLFANYLNQASIYNENPTILSVAVLSTANDGYHRWATALSAAEQLAEANTTVTADPGSGYPTTGNPFEEWDYF